MQNRDMESSDQKGSERERKPVMFCQTAASEMRGGVTKPLARGQAPSTPTCASVAPKKPRLTELMFFRCSPEDKEAIADNAARAGLERSSYLRTQSIGKPVMRACRRIRADWDELRRCMGVINKAGNVVNQLVLELRRYGGRAEAVDAALAELRRAAQEIVAALKQT